MQAWQTIRLSDVIATAYTMTNVTKYELCDIATRDHVWR
ncbi:hypothetical protein VIA_003671 [Vibrio orientalis CIP 102891 = ATCC 33934]|uniref:Uncharacterized protein n=1 Tax=Vibrio orientalis CIP 102891 = ATCC 33934 TaxID=675816 RepID=A0ABP2GY01_VIBOR|nr:hypothetical protein VIA_003671 [Vibrio orientalis CIP 102891 = ATCC 33934]